MGNNIILIYSINAELISEKLMPEIYILGSQNVYKTYLLSDIGSLALPGIRRLAQILTGSHDPRSGTGWIVCALD